MVNEKAMYADCSGCPYESRPFCATGWPTAQPSTKYKFAIVGEAPGQTEVAKGAPFIGDSGLVLNAALTSAGLDREEILITNAVLCRPPNNEDPDVEALIACKRRLISDLFDNRSTHILAVGRWARNALWPDEHEVGITINRGRWRQVTIPFDDEEHTMWTLPTIHPAYCLRRPSMARDFIEDVEKFAKAQPLSFIPTRVEIYGWHGEDDCEPGGLPYDLIVHKTCNRLRNFSHPTHTQPVISIDLETAGYNWMSDRILNISFSDRGGIAFVIAGDLVYDEQVIRTLTSLFFYPGITWVGHNLKFDIKFMYHQLGIAPPLSDDTMIMHFALDERPGTHALKGLVSRMFDMPDYEMKYVFPYLKKKSDSFALVPWRKLAIYAGMDTDYTGRFYYKARKQLKQEGLWFWPYKNLLLPAQDMFVDVELRGFAVDWQGVEKVGERLQGEVDQFTWELINLVGDDEFNPNSSRQVQHEVYDVRGLPQPHGRTIKKRSCNKEALHKLRKQFPREPFLAAIVKYRRVKKLLSSYILNLPRYAGDDARVHPTFRVMGAETGRIAVRNPALQTIPRSVTDEYGKLIRDLYIAGPGQVLIHADYSQAELRVMAVLSQEPFLLGVYRDGRDLHSEVARSMYGDDFTREDRNMCKMFNFSYAYGGTERSFAEDAGLPLQKAKEWVYRYNENMPRLLAWRDEQFETLRTQGYIEYPVGFRRRVSLITRRSKNEARKIAINAPVQGTASFLTTASACKLHRELLPEGVYILLLVHDSIESECWDDDQIILDAACIIKHTMESTATDIMGDDIPFPVDIEVGYRWGSLVKYDGTRVWRDKVEPVK